MECTLVGSLSGPPLSGIEFGSFFGSLCDAHFPRFCHWRPTLIMCMYIYTSTTSRAHQNGSTSVRSDGQLPADHHPVHRETGHDAIEETDYFDELDSPNLFASKIVEVKAYNLRYALHIRACAGDRHSDTTPLHFPTHTQ